MAEFSCCRIIPGRSFRPARPEFLAPGFSCPSPRVWCGTGYPSRVSPEGAQSLREAGVSSPGDRSLRSVDRHRQRLCPGAESPPSPEFPVPRTRVSGPSPSEQRVVRYWCPVRRVPGGRPEFPACTRVSGLLGRSLRPK